MNENANEEYFDFKREVNQEIFYYILGNVYEEMERTSFSMDNDTFYMQMYNWLDEEDNTPNFYHKPSGFKLWWYKYPLRGVRSNMSLTSEQFRNILYDCRNSLSNYSKYEIYKWWESKD